MAATVTMLSSPPTLYALDEMFTIGNEIYYYNPDDTCTSNESNLNVTSVTGSGAPIQATLAQANVVTPSKHSVPQRTRFIGTMQKFSSDKPDFVTLNEISPSTNTNYAEYKSYKEVHPKSETTEDGALRILWNSDKWKKVDGGIEKIHKLEEVRNSAKKDRYALWAVFQNTNNGGLISVIATHFNVRGTFSPNHGRAKSQSENLKTITDTLLAKGPVLIGGDFNFQHYAATEPYSPATILGKSGLKSVFKKGEGTAVDWIFYSNQLKNTKKKVYPTDRSLSDHPYVVGSFEGSSGAGSVSDSGGCICKAANASTSLIGSKNDEKAFNYFKSKGLSDIQTAGILGNMAIESGFDPENVQNGTSEAEKYGERTKNPAPLMSAGWGLIQWTPGSKIIPAAKAAKLSDRPIHELATQLDLVWAHLHNDPPITKGSFSVPEYKKINDIEKAVNYFEDKIEGAGTPNYVDRYTAARLALETYGGSGSTSPASSATSSTIDSCDSVGDGATAGNAVQTAINYAWSDYRAKGTEGALTLKPSYKKAVDTALAKGEYVGGIKYDGVDCGGFVTLTMKNSGVDPQYGGGGNTDAQLSYLETSGKYREIKNPTSADMVPGAIAIRSGHTYMYVGDNPGFETKIASASLDSRAPMAGKELAADRSYRWFVLK